MSEASDTNYDDPNDDNRVNGLTLINHSFDTDDCVKYCFLLHECTQRCSAHVSFQNVCCVLSHYELVKRS